MTYNDHHATFTRKVAQYDMHMCRRAMADCYDTLAHWGADIAESYATKLWAEIDALRNRQMALNKAA